MEEREDQLDERTRARADGTEEGFLREKGVSASNLDAPLLSYRGNDEQSCTLNINFGIPTKIILSDLSFVSSYSTFFFLSTWYELTFIGSAVSLSVHSVAMRFSC